MLAHENESQGFAQVLTGRDAPFISIDLELGKLENKLPTYLGDSEKLSLYIRLMLFSVTKWHAIVICVINSSWLAGSFPYAKSRTQAPSTFWFCHCLDFRSPLWPVVERQRWVEGINWGPDMPGIPSVLLLLVKTSLMSLSECGGRGLLGHWDPSWAAAPLPKKREYIFGWQQGTIAMVLEAVFPSGWICFYPWIFLLFYQ